MRRRGRRAAALGGHGLNHGLHIKEVCMLVISKRIGVEAINLF